MTATTPEDGNDILAALWIKQRRPSNVLAWTSTP